MNIKVAAFTVSEKSSITSYICAFRKCFIFQLSVCKAFTGVGVLYHFPISKMFKCYGAKLLGLHETTADICYAIFIAENKMSCKLEHVKVIHTFFDLI